jgi:hypothetical protein
VSELAAQEEDPLLKESAFGTAALEESNSETESALLFNAQLAIQSRTENALRSLLLFKLAQSVTTRPSQVSA